jgi:hypothetical protein
MTRGRNTRIIKVAATHVCECGYETASETGIGLHRKAAHGLGVPDTTDITHTYRCNTCRAVFENGFLLVTHSRHSGHTDH